jgi:hypothetical protein
LKDSPVKKHNFLKSSKNNDKNKKNEKDSSTASGGGGAETEEEKKKKSEEEAASPAAAENQEKFAESQDQVDLPSVPSSSSAAEEEVQEFFRPSVSKEESERLIMDLVSDQSLTLATKLVQLVRRISVCRWCIYMCLSPLLTHNSKTKCLISLSLSLSLSLSFHSVPCIFFPILINIRDN